MSKVSPLMNIPNHSSVGSDWIEWHRVLKSNFGKREANALWLKAWHKQGNTYDANDHALREYMSKNGIDIEKGILSAAYDTGAGVLDGIGDIFKMGEYAVITMGVILIAGLAMTVYNIAKNPAQAAGTALKGGANG